jgi:FkbM family methyltransferase
MEQFQFYSQVGQDKYVYETFFKNKKDGFFLDIGAHDGLDKSNSFFFEKNLNWNGICIEPIPEVYSRLKANRNCICINAGLSDKIGKATFWKIEGYSEMLSGLEENYNEQHKQRIKKEIEEHGGILKEIQIDILDINTVLKNNNIDKVDYCTIDVEGSEQKILSVFNSKEFDITVFTIENNYQDRSLRTLMKNKGYKLHSKIDFDDVFVKRKSWFFF